MMLTIVLFVLFATSCWLYSLIDVALTPSAAFQGRLSKGTWVGIIAATFTLGAIAWLLAQSRCRRPWEHDAPAWWAAAEVSLARHPAGRFREAATRTTPRGPDDDPDFMRALGQVTRGTAPDNG
jgi:hypothetical protein